MRPKHNAKTGACVVSIVRAPHLPGSKCATWLLSGPASQAVDPVRASWSALLEVHGIQGQRRAILALPSPLAQAIRLIEP